MAGVRGHLKCLERLSSFLAGVQLEEKGDHFIKVVLFVALAVLVLKWGIGRLAYILEEHLEGDHIGLGVCLAHLTEDLPGFLVLVDSEKFLYLLVVAGLGGCRVDFRTTLGTGLAPLAPWLRVES